MNNEQIMQELQSSFDSDYGVSQQLIDNVARLIQENEKLKAKIDVINWQEKTSYEILKEKYISKDKMKEKIEEIKNYTYSSKEERQCQNYAIDRLKELMEVDNE